MSIRNPNIVCRPAPKRVAIVLANPTISTTTGWPVGFWWSELSHPYAAFVEAGYDVTICSVSGGLCKADAMSDPHDASGYSAHDLISAGFMALPALSKLIDNTQSIDKISVSEFDALLVAGGQSPMFSFENATALHEKFVEFYEAGKIVAALCHGVAVLRYAKLSNGEYLVKGKTVTGFANIEEDFADKAVWDYGLLPQGSSIMPWRIEDELKRLGANFIQAGLWKPFAIRDGNLVTGQQNFSGQETARLIIDALGR